MAPQVDGETCAQEPGTWANSTPPSTAARCQARRTMPDAGLVECPLSLTSPWCRMRFIALASTL